MQDDLVSTTSPDKACLAEPQKREQWNCFKMYLFAGIKRKITSMVYRNLRREDVVSKGKGLAWVRLTALNSRSTWSGSTAGDAWVMGLLKWYTVMKWTEGREKRRIITAREKHLVVLITQSSAPKLPVLPGHRTQGAIPKRWSVARHLFVRVAVFIASECNRVQYLMFLYIPRKGLFHLLHWTSRTLRSFFVL